MAPHAHVHEHCLKMATREDGTPWWAEFPEPQTSAAKIGSDEVLAMLETQHGQEPQDPEKRSDFLLVDTRRTDFAGGTIVSAINCPAHSFYPTRKALYQLCKLAGIRKVVFYCGSSNGRGPRCASWMQDYIDEVGGDMESLVMEGGIRGWVRTHGGLMMEGFDETVWQKEHAH